MDTTKTENMIVATETAQGASVEVKAAKSSKAKKNAAAVKLTRLLAIGTRGCAFAELSEEQIKRVKLNDENALFAKEHRTDAQLIAARAGRWQNSLAYDSRSYVTSRGQASTFWLGTLENALKAKMVRAAKAIVKEKGKEKAIACYVRTAWNSSEAFEQYIAVDDTLGRIESVSVGHGEKRRKGSCKNALFAKAIESIEVSK